MRKRIAGILLLLLIFRIPAGKAGAAEKKWTLLVYMCGSNLESSYGSASSDLREMIASGFDNKEVNVLVMTGGTSYWGMGFPPEELSICEISARGHRVVSREESRSMGAAETLKHLIDFGVENYPAEDYALILWDHGGGIAGLLASIPLCGKKEEYDPYHVESGES